jgi:hypothetical protein
MVKRYKDKTMAETAMHAEQLLENGDMAQGWVGTGSNGCRQTQRSTEMH